MRAPFSLALIFASSITFAESAPCGAGTEQLSDPQRVSICKALSLRERLDRSMVSEEDFVRTELNPSESEREMIRQDLDGGNSRHPYTVTVLSYGARTCKKNVVILGESHIKKNAAAAAGREVFESFRFRGFEGAPKREIASMVGEDRHLAIREALTKIGVFQGSTIDWARDRGITFIENESIESLVSFLQLSIRSSAFEVDPSRRCRKMASPGSPENDPLRNYLKFLDVYSELVKTETKASYNFHLEIGDVGFRAADCKDFRSARCADYIGPRRDARMARNIREIVPRLPCGESLLVIVGQNHLSGLQNLLVLTGDYRAPKLHRIGSAK